MITQSIFMAAEWKWAISANCLFSFNS